MAKKHNQWMKILSTVFSFLSSLFNSIKLPSSEAAASEEPSENSEE